MSDVLRVVVAANGMSRRQGGLFHSIRKLWQSVLPCGIESEIFAVSDPDSVEDTPAWAPLRVNTFPRSGHPAINYSPELGKALSDAAKGAAVVSFHGLWTYPSYAAHRAASRANVPFMIHPEGMLDPWALRHGKLRKRAALALFQRAALDGAACLRALCPAERDAFRAMGLRGPVAIVPNGIDAADWSSLPERDALVTKFPILEDKRRALFLGRLHPKKGLLDFLPAWAEVASRDWTLIIAGPDEGGHERDLRVLAKRLSLGDRVLFTGSLFGADKLAAFAAADMFVLPSHSEGFPIALLEAAAAGLPVLQTHHCNFPELTQAGGAVSCPATREGFVTSLKRMLEAMTAVELRRMGAAGRELVFRDYTWTRVGERMESVVRWLAGEHPRPDWVEA